MAIVFIPAALRQLTDGVTQVAMDVATVAAAVEELESRYPGIKSRLCDGDELRHSLRVSVDSSVTSRGLRAKVNENSEIHFVHAIGGG